MAIRLNGSCRSLAIGILLVAMILANVATVSALATNGKAQDNGDTTQKMVPINPEENLAPVHLIKVDPAIKNATPYWLFLVVDDEGMKTWLKNIDESNLSKAEKKQMKNNMTNLWKKYPVKHTNDGNNTAISFSSSNKHISASDNATIKEIFEARASSIENSDTVSPMWGQPQHGDIAYDAASKWGFQYSTTVRDAADDPDTWTANIPSWLPSEVQSFLQTCVHSYEHYYNPTWPGVGGAPENTATYANLAKQNVPGNWYFAAFYLGWASHFITDVGNPMHTGGEANQAYDYYYHPAGYQNMHDAYEGYVASNWNDGDGYDYFYKSYATDNWYYVPVSDPAQATKDLASFSNGYCETLIVTISNHRDTFGTDSNVRAATQNVITVTDRYMLGIVHYAKGNN